MTRDDSAGDYTFGEHITSEDTTSEHTISNGITNENRFVTAY